VYNPIIKVFGVKKWPLGKPKHRREDNIERVLKKQEGMAWTGRICLKVQGRVTGFCERGDKPSFPQNEKNNSIS
jgi:hypothetical protein